MNKIYDDTSIDSILKHATQCIDKSLSELLTKVELGTIGTEIDQYGKRRKGHFGDLVEEYIFGIKNNSEAAPDFPKVGVELKTTPLKIHAKKKYVAKERLVFSMINYMDIIHETWESSSFLKKNKLLLLMFYLYEQDVDLTKYKFKHIYLLDLLSHISTADIIQIKHDWETIVNKIISGNAHLLSEGDTSYLGAATKASKATDRRPQPNNSINAKPRAFSLKPTYLNFIIQTHLKEKDKEASSLFHSSDMPMTIEEIVKDKFSLYINKTNLEIEQIMGIFYDKRPKSHRRLLVNKLLGTNSNKIEEFEKANITLKVIALEKSGRLVEAISFPIFRYESIVNQLWDESEFNEQLSTKRFLFVIFRKTDNTDEAILESYKFWNFPMNNIDEAKWVWEETVLRIKNKKANALPGIKDNFVAHVRPHARNSEDTLPTGYGTFEIKKCFWLNAKYIEEQLKS